MKTAIIGTGYIGLSCGAGFAEFGHDVFCTDTDENKIFNLQKGIVSVFETGLQQLVDKHLNKNLNFTLNIKEAVSDADFIIITVAAPLNGSCKDQDVQSVYSAVKSVIPYIKHKAVIAVKTTVPAGTCRNLEKIISEIRPELDFFIISLPEFLREGFALNDFFNPDRIIVGYNGDIEKIRHKIYSLYSGADKNKFIFMKTESSETVKYAANSFLAMKVQYINEIALFCEKTGADISEVIKGTGSDKRIGFDFMNPGPGFGGFCLPKDTEAMVKYGKDKKINLSLTESVVKGNKKQKEITAAKISDMVKDINNPKIAVLGLAFKAGTDDCRQSPAVDIIKILSLNNKLKISVYDPVAAENAKKLLGASVEYADNEYLCCKDADIIVILTEWPQFGELDYSVIAKSLKNKNIFDARNLLDGSNLIKLGFKYRCIGKKF